MRLDSAIDGEDTNKSPVEVFDAKKGYDEVSSKDIKELSDLNLLELRRMSRFSKEMKNVPLKNVIDNYVNLKKDIKTTTATRSKSNPRT